MLHEKYLHFGVIMCMVGFPKIAKQAVDIDDTPIDIEEFKDSISKCGPEFNLTANNFREILAELNEIVSAITDEFKEVFGENIFAQQPAPLSPLKRRGSGEPERYHERGLP